MMQKIYTGILLILAAGFSACEDKIDLNVDPGKSYPVLDAWITNEKGPQQIRFTQSATSYTDNTPAPLIKDAKITLYDITASKTYAFAFKDDAYKYDPGSENSIGVIDHVYKLRVEYKGETFEATDTLKRVPLIDSISYEFKKKDEAQSGEEGYYARLHAKDIAGGDDYYWIRSYRNDRANRLQDLYAINGAFNEGVADGWLFITPIREGITDEDKPFQPGEKVIVRVASLSHPSYLFIQQVIDQLNSGGLFAKVLENVKSNAVNVTPDGKLKMLGWFGASGASFDEREVNK
jgi:hypothetical protein